jgi:peptide/nickel transport system substrate-binding protein
VIVRIAVKNMRAAGIDVREGFVDAGVYLQNLPVGDFDLIMYSAVPPASPSRPWSSFEAVMSSRSWKPIGEKVTENQGRYNKPGSAGYNPAVDSLLKVIPTLSDPAGLKKAYRALNVIFMQDQVSIPLVYRPDYFYEFSTLHWSHFPTADDPYAPPQCLCVGAGVNALWEIKPVAGK